MDTRQLRQKSQIRKKKLSKKSYQLSTPDEIEVQKRLGIHKLHRRY